MRGVNQDPADDRREFRKAGATLPNSQNDGSAASFYIRNRGRVLGPFSVERLKALRARGQFSRVHEVSQDGNSWQPATTLGVLFGEAETSGPQEAWNSQNSPSQTASDSPSPAAASQAPGATWFYNVGG